MNFIYRSFLSLVFFISISFIYASPPDWAFGPDQYGQYEFLATLTGIVDNNGQQLGDDSDDLLAVFDSDGEIRGLAVALTAPFGPYAGTILYELQVYSNLGGEELSFQFYDASEDEILTISNTYAFTINEILGNVPNPYVFNVALGGGGENNPDWAFGPDQYGQYEFLATLTGMVDNDGQQLGDDADDLLAAFDSDGGIRGLAVALTAPFGPYAGTLLYELQVYSNLDGEELSFQFYDASEDEVLTISNTYTFTINEILGNVPNPYVFEVGSADLGCPPCEDLALTSYSLDCATAVAVFPGGCDFGTVAEECPATCGTCPEEDACGVCEGDGSTCEGECADVDITSYSLDCATVIAVFPGGCDFGTVAEECPDSCGLCGDCDDVDSDGVCDDEDDCVGSFDECDVCNGDSSSCSDCAGVPNGDAEILTYYLDSDGDGLGGFISQEFCSANIPGGWVLNNLDVNDDLYCISNEIDDCEICDGGNLDQDCAGECFGLSWESDCGCVAADNSGDDCDDCAGVPNGNNNEDECGVCDDDSSNDCVQDCAGVWGGSSVLVTFCEDTDGDGFGNPGSETEECVESGRDDQPNNSITMYCDGTGTCDVEYHSDNPIAGFQFNVIGATVSGAHAGEPAEDAGFTISTSSTTVLGFSFSGSTLPATDEPLGLVHFDYIDGEPSGLSSLVFSDFNGDQLSIQYWENSEGSDDADLVLDCSDEYPDCAANEFDCNSDCGGSAEDLGCGCGEPGPSGCDNSCGSDLVNDECGVCGGDNSSCDEGCGPNEPGPSGCDNACGSDLVDDECGVCGGDNSSCEDCAGVPNGNNNEDECGVCDDDSSNDCVQDCAGVWGGSSVLVTFCEDTDGDGFGNPGSETEECVDGGRDITGGCDLPDLNIYLDENGAVYYNSSEDISGFQFDVDGAIVSGGSGGDMAENGLIGQAAGSTFISFSFTGSAIPAGCGTLVNLNLNGQASGLSNIVFSDQSASQIYFEYYIDSNGSDLVLDCSDEYPDCAVNEFDCNGDCGGTAEDLGCGCGEPGPSGCDNVCGSTAELDECGVCGGDGIADGACDCDGNVEDCAGECGGASGVDNCGTCDDEPLNDCLVVVTSPANGDIWQMGTTHTITWTGGYGNTGVHLTKDGWDTPEDDLVIHGNVGSVTSYDWTIPTDLEPANDYRIRVYDAAGPDDTQDFSDYFTISGPVLGCTDSLACNFDVDATEDDGSCLQDDCAGECGGLAVEDECGVCGGDGIADGACDCEGNVDLGCGCGEAEPSGCDDACGSTLENDDCGVCGGDNSSCSGCVDSYALNYDPSAILSDGSCEYPVYGCMEEDALNFDPNATDSNGDCDYNPELGLSFGNIDAVNGAIEILGSLDKDLEFASFTISGATITGLAGENADDVNIDLSENTISFSGLIGAGSGTVIVLTYVDGGSEFCLDSASASAPGYDSVNISLGGCSVFVGADGGEIASDDGGVNIPEGALAGSENISIGDVTEELPEEVDNATGFDVDEIVAFTPFDIEFEVPVEITISSSSRSSRDEYLCYLEDANDTEWAVVEGASCTNGTCVADVNSFGIFATCVLVEDCNGDLGGFAYLDDCGDCVGGDTGNDANYSMDECGLCGGPGLIDWYVDSDGDNLGYGDGVPFCSDIVPGGYVPNNSDDEPNCATNDTDECGLCGGDGAAEGFDCDGNCIAAGGYDCNNECGGSAVNDECGVCSGDNSSCTDCNGDINGSAFIDGCESCVGGLTGLEACPTDCNGVDGGTAWVDACGVCVDAGDSSCTQGCDGNWSNDGSGLTNDECGVCNGDNSSCTGCVDDSACNFAPDATIGDDSCIYSEDDYDCLGNCVIEVDCLGVCGGTSAEDECGVCNGPGTSTWYADGDGDGLGDSNDSLDSCDSLDGYVPNDDDVEPDCGTNDTDECGACGGGGIAEGECDCDGNIDLGCGCGEDGPSGCDETCGSNLEFDECGECGGDGPAENFTCEGFQPGTKEALQNAVDAWKSDASSAEMTYGHISGWEVSLITDMELLFAGTWDNHSLFNDDIGNWDVSNVTNMNSMFFWNADFNQDISSWNVSNVTNMHRMFQNCYDFNQPLGDWDVSNVTDMFGMLATTSFNQDVSGWDLSSIDVLSYLFKDNTSFNQDISGWDVSNATEMQNMFNNADSFNQDISGWDVSNVWDMEGVFQNNDIFNQDITGWNVSSVTDMRRMFYNNSAFNYNISSWDISNVIDMDEMFDNASALSEENQCSIHGSFQSSVAWPYNWCDQDCAGEWGGDAVVDECGVCGGDGSGCGGIDYCLSIHSGANLKSFYGLPEDLSVANVMQTLGESATGVITEGGAASQIAPGLWVGSLTEISAQKGYWIVSTADSDLCFEDAALVDENAQYNLHSGANLISFPIDGSAGVSGAIPDDVESSISGIITEGGAASQLSPGLWVGSMTEFNGGKGYWVISGDDISFVFDLSGLGRLDSDSGFRSELPIDDSFDQSTRQSFYFIEDIIIDGELVSNNDWIFAYNGETLVGAKQWGGSYSDIGVMGNDGMLETDRYCEVGSSVELKVFKQSTGEYYQIIDLVPAWDDNGLFIVPTLTARIMPSETLISSAYPNPFNPVTQIEFGIEKDGHVNAAIYDVSGRVVEELVNGVFNAGYHSLSWNGDSESSGLYFLVIHSGGVSVTQKLMLLK